MVSRPLVTVLMPTHSRVDVIAHSIRSVLDQTLDDFELLVVGDGAADGTGDIVASFGDPRIRYFDFPKAPTFGYANRNRALREAHGKLIGFAADDDLLFPDHLELLTTGLRDGAAIACSQALWVSTDGVLVPFHSNLEMGDELQLFMEKANSIPASCFLYRADALPQIDAWPEDVPSAADWRLWQRIIRENQPNPLRYVRHPTVLHFSALWKNSRSAGMGQVAMLLGIADAAEWWPEPMRADVPGGVPEQAVFAKFIRENPAVWAQKVREASQDVVARIARDWVWAQTFSSDDPPSQDARIMGLRRQIQMAEARAADLALRCKELTEAHDRQIAAYLESRSWRVTAPLRALSRAIKRLRP